MHFRFYLLLPSIVLTSCVTTSKLSYDPIQYEPIRPELIPQKKAPSFAIFVHNFTDERPKKTIGLLRAPSGLPLKKIVASIPVESWAKEALMLELSHAGYGLENGPTNAKYEIEGKILKAHTYAGLECQGKVKIEMTVKQGDRCIFSKHYESKKNKQHWTGKISLELLKKNLQNVYREFLRDFQYSCQ